MSDSDSDLDYASADEDTNCDTNFKGRMQHKNDNSETAYKLSDSEEVTQSKPTASETEKVVSCMDTVKEEHLTAGSAQTTDIPCHANSVDLNELSHISTSEDKQSKNNSSEKKLESSVVEDTCDSKTVKNNSDGSLNKAHTEKQRIPLRLEKKLQQKQQVPREDTVDSGVTSTSEEVFTKPEEKSSWGFGSWGTSFLSSAASSVSTFTNQVSQGIGTVFETVESTLGAPPPEELAATLKNKEARNSTLDNSTDNDSNTETQDDSSSEVKSSILPNVASWTKVLEDTGSKVLMGGLDTLELIGKKTIDIITEGDPGLRKKRSAFSEYTTLSQILREAKAEADESMQDKDSEEAETVHYSQMFDEYQGLVHLEALEMLSMQSEGKIQLLLMRIPRDAEVRKNIQEIKSICENIPQLDDPTDSGDFEDFVPVCQKYVLELNVIFNVENIIKTQKRITEVLKNYEDASTITSTPEEIYHSAICSLAEFTAKSIEAFHKLAELILVQPTLEPNVEHFATNLTGLTTVMCVEINNLSSRYHRCLDSISEQCETESSKMTTVVTNLYLEAENSNKYIQDAFLLLVPVLQVSLLESLQ